MKSTLILSALRFFSKLSLRSQRRLGTLCGDFAFFANTRMAQTTHTNLRLAFPELPEAERRALARNSLRHTFRAICEAGGTWLWPAERAFAGIERVDGLPVLREALAQGSGVMVISPHIGNWELLGLYLNTLDLGQTHQLFQPPTDPAFAKLIYEARSRSGANMVATDKQGVMMMLKALRAGEVVGILPDQVPPPESGDYAPFFTHPALTMTLVTRFQKKTGARVICGVALRTETGFKIIFSEPDPAIYADDPADALAGLNATVEALVRQTPEQYQWEYKRFKKQPPGMRSPYSA